MKHDPIKDKIKGACPPIPFLRKALAKKKLAELPELLTPEQVARGEENPAEKSKLVSACKEKWKGRYERGERAINDVFERAPYFASADAEERERLRTDIQFCRFAYGFITSEYLAYALDKADAATRRSFISEREHRLYYLKMNDSVEARLFNDKMKTYERFKPYYHREIVSIESRRGFRAFRDFVRAHPVFVKKEVYESCGNSVERIDMASCSKTEVELFAQLLSRGKTVLEELVVQGAATAAFNTSSVNTVRLITFRTKHGIKIPYAFMKIGRAGSFIDNGGAGGILAGVDEKTGVVNTRGIDELHREYDVHPDSGMPFVGHRLPQWEQLLSMCREMTEKAPTIGYIGWDYAYTDKDEWVVIEGNGMSQFIGPQTIWQRGIKAEVEGYMNDMELMF